jgi:CRISPR/Cas system-associated endoribonuclease Cas2
MVMKEVERTDIKSMVETLKQLDKESLLIINTGAQMLKARQDMGEETKDEKEKQLA